MAHAIAVVVGVTIGLIIRAIVRAARQQPHRPSDERD